MIDLDRKIIFTHPPKTGGTTVESAFRWHPKYVPDSPRHLTFFRNFKHASLERHVRYAEENLGLRGEDFFKFVCVRNPWDIAVSWYYFDQDKNIISKTTTFEEYLNRRCKEERFLNIFPFINYKNNFYIDYVIRYENYKEDAEQIFEKYGVDWNEDFHTHCRPKNTPYQSLYTPNTRNMIAEKAKGYIDTFGYSF